jgi:hypothetical protein
MWRLVVILVLTAAILEGIPPGSTARPRLDPVYGGTVAFLRTPTEIAIAADSLSVAPDDPSITRSGCRIFQIARSNLFIAVTGFDAQAAGGLNQIALINRAHLSNKTILATANAFAQAVIGPLVLELQRLKSDSAVNYGRDFEGKPVIAIIFCGFEKGAPVVYEREFVAYTAQDGKISIRVDSMDCPGPLCETDGIGGNVLGQGSAAPDPIRSGRLSFDLADGAAASVRRLVQRRIDDQTNDDNQASRDVDRTQG